MYGHTNILIDDLIEEINERQRLKFRIKRNYDEIIN